MKQQFDLFARHRLRPPTESLRLKAKIFKNKCMPLEKLYKAESQSTKAATDSKLEALTKDSKLQHPTPVLKVAVRVVTYIIDAVPPGTEGIPRKPKLLAEPTYLPAGEKVPV